MTHAKDLHQLYKMLQEEYCSYRRGLIDEKEYCTRAKPIDEAIGNLEMATLRGIPVLKGSSLSLSHMPES